MIRIIIADDHQIVCRGVQQIVSDEVDMTVVGEAHNAEEMLALVRQQPCDVVVTDITLSDRRGIDVLEELKQDRQAPPVLVFSMHSENQYALRALKSGAAGYLTKDSPPEELVKAIRKVASGETYFGSSLSARLVLNLATDNGRPRHQALSEREFQILCMIVSGKSVRGISRELSVSPRTIWTYRARILEKMAMKNNAELIQYAIGHGLVGGTSRNGDRLPASDPE